MTLYLNIISMFLCNDTNNHVFWGGLFCFLWFEIILMSTFNVLSFSPFQEYFFQISSSLHPWWIKQNKTTCQQGEASSLRSNIFPDIVKYTRFFDKYFMISMLYKQQLCSFWTLGSVVFLRTGVIAFKSIHWKAQQVLHQSQTAAPHCLVSCYSS